MRSPETLLTSMPAAGEQVEVEGQVAGHGLGLDLVGLAATTVRSPDTVVKRSVPASWRVSRSPLTVWAVMSDADAVEGDVAGDAT